MILFDIKCTKYNCNLPKGSRRAPPMASSPKLGLIFGFGDQPLFLVKIADIVRICQVQG